MPMPQSTVEEVRASVLRYLRMYEEGNFTLSDLAAELAVMSGAYDHALGAHHDAYGDLLSAAHKYKTEQAAHGGVSQEELEAAVTEFRRSDAAW